MDDYLEMTDRNQINTTAKSDSTSGEKLTCASSPNLWSVEGMSLAMIKIGDQSSPLMLKQMPKKYSVGCVAFFH